MGLGQKLKETFSPNDGAFDRAKEQNRTPGSFPTDESKYHPPTGTHVGRSDETGLTGRAEDTLTGSHGHGSSTAERNVDERNLMDPADRRHGSNVMDSTGTSGNPLTQSGTQEGDQHNKLHKRDDPRRYEDERSGIGSGRDVAGSGAVYSGDKSRDQHHGLGRDRTGYGEETSRRHGDDSGLTSSHIPRERGSTLEQGSTSHARNPVGAYDNPATATSGSHGSHGIYNTVTGTGSHEDSRHHRQHETTSSSIDNPNIRQGHDSRITGGTAVGTAVGTGVGSHDMAYRPHETTGSTSYDQRREPLGTTTGTGAATSTIPSTHPSNIGTATSTGPGYGHAGPDESIRSQAQTHGQGTHQPLSQSGITSGQSQSHLGSSTVNPATTGAMGTAGTSTSAGSGDRSGHYGPGHTGAKVLHPCEHCGKDNDISKYFNREAVYRLS